MREEDILTLFFTGVGIFILFIIVNTIKNLIIYKTLNPNIIKGIWFERKCVKELKKQGYEVDFRGERLGRADGGIDIEAKKGDIVLLIQCKNYNRLAKIDDKILRIFNGDIYSFILSKSPRATTNLFVSYHNQLNVSGKMWLMNNPQVQYLCFKKFKEYIIN